MFGFRQKNNRINSFDNNKKNQNKFISMSK